METKEPATLASAILAVMAAVPYVQRRGEMAGRGGGYRYLTERDLVSALRPAMIQAGLALIPIRVDAATTAAGTSRSGAVQWRTEGTWTWRLVHTSGESMEIQAGGMATDGGDKGLNQAQTHATKNMLRSLFLVESGDEPDAVPSVDQEVVSHHPDFDRLRSWFCAELRQRAGLDPARFMSWVEGLGYGRPSSWNEKNLRAALEAAVEGRGPGGVAIPKALHA